MLVNVAKKKAIEIVETAEIAKTIRATRSIEDGKSGEYLGTFLALVFSIWYPITF